MNIRTIFFLLLLSLVSRGFAQTWDTYADTWVATDDLGRELLPVGEKPDPLSYKPSSVGMFYYLWHGKHTKEGRPIFDITNILKENPKNPKWGDVGEMHWWGKPVLGYYKAGDDFVVAKHLQLLMDAGVDFLFFDVTNGFLYDDVVEKLIREIDRRDSLGMKSPKLCFMSYWGGEKMIEKIYSRFYADKKYNKYWYLYQGKPLILADIESVPVTSLLLRNFFAYRKSWAWMKGANRNEWAWLESCPQVPGWSANPNTPEQLSVSVAQHATTKIGKSYHNGTEPILNALALTDSTAYGLYFNEQWRIAHKIHPPVLMITQFNEWTAQRFCIQDSAHLNETRPGITPKIGETCFVDAYNAEFNRDIEPSRHPLIRDNYYMQFVSNMRKYKGGRVVPEQSSYYTINLNRNFKQWNSVEYEYRDDKGDVIHQNTMGFNNMDTIVNNTGRNDFVISKVAHDKTYLYFFAETMNNITPAQPSCHEPWITLLLSINKKNDNWHGYDYCVKADGNKLKLYKNEGGTYKWTPLCGVSFKVVGNKIQLAVPRKRIPESKIIDFKWTDNIPESENLDILDLYVYGDVAPNGRFNYRYKY
ncbi:hypothetical protein [uncultured Bacteroides sp.]|uniref:hypothetical protein n=1 Tax=uncultured Bacteroides sp. TaxID=162156 RepID=UPI002AAB96EE|nr:hypothetical protein [uncultured Bacteroides sp.]